MSQESRASRAMPYIGPYVTSHFCDVAIVLLICHWFRKPLQTPHEHESTPYIYTYYEHIIYYVSVQSPVFSLLNTVIEYTVFCKCTGWVKNSPPWGFLTFFSKQLGIFRPNFTSLLQVHTYHRIQIFIQLSATLLKLCHIKRDHHHMLKMFTIGWTHAGWSHLIWHNFNKVADNWIKICILW